MNKRYTSNDTSSSDVEELEVTVHSGKHNDISPQGSYSFRVPFYDTSDVEPQGPREHTDSRRHRDKSHKRRDRHNGTHSSISSIHSHGSRKPNSKSVSPSSPEELQGVYIELQKINEKLKDEFAVLHERDMALKEKDKALSVAYNDFETRVEEEVQRRILLREKEFKEIIYSAEEGLQEKKRENRRLKENFETLKNANETLRKQLDSLQTAHDKMEKQSSSLQSRLINLQRKHEHDQRKEDEFLPQDMMKNKKTNKETKELKPSNVKNYVKPCASTYEVLSVLLEWASEVNMRPTLADLPVKSTDGIQDLDYLLDRCFKVLPSLVEMVKDLPRNNTLVLSTLQFTYWSLMLIEPSTGPKKSGLTSTFRRLGEQLYCPKSRLSEGGVRCMDTSLEESSPEADRSKENQFFKSQNVQIRFLSCLIILRTVTQVDHLANVFDVLRSDLKREGVKMMYQHYYGNNVILQYVKASNKGLLNSAVDILLQMSTESEVLPSFLESCSSELWFRAVSMVMRMPGMDLKIIEKLSVILQKVSKIKTNKRYFEVFGMTGAVQEMLRKLGNENPFLTLNLKSILFNLNIKTSGPAGSGFESGLQQDKEKLTKKTNIVV